MRRETGRAWDLAVLVVLDHVLSSSPGSAPDPSGPLNKTPRTQKSHTGAMFAAIESRSGRRGLDSDRTEGDFFAHQVVIRESSGMSLDRENDEALVELARQRGDHDARPFDVLVRRYQGMVKANCRAITRSAADAEDLAQEVFLKAFFGLKRFEGRAPFRNWLQRIKVNHCLNHLRKTRGTVMLDIDEVPPEHHDAMQTAAGAHEALETADERERIVAVLDTMSDALRIPLMLCDGDGHSYEEIAVHLGISLSAVKMRIKRGRAQFRERFSARAEATQTLEVPTA